MPFDPSVTQNVNGFYSDHFLDAMFEGDEGVRAAYAKWEEASDPPAKKLVGLSRDYFRSKSNALKTAHDDDRLEETTGLNRAVCGALGYDARPNNAELVPTKTGVAAVPVLARVDRDGHPYLFILDAAFRRDEDDAVLERRVVRVSTDLVRLEGQSAFTGTYEDALSAIFRCDEPPKWVMVVAGNEVILADRHKWGQGKWLRFDLDRAFEKRGNAYQQIAVLLSKDTLCPDGESALHDGLDDRSHRHAFGVSTDLKDGLREAVEVLANEYLHDRRFRRKVATFSAAEEENLAQTLKEESLRYLYRLLFLFYAEARGEELEIIPMKSEEYRQGYSLEHLRDLEQIPLDTPEALDGLFLDESLRKLFDIVNNGHGPQQLFAETEGFDAAGFRMRGLHSPLFDMKASTPELEKAQFRNVALQKVIQLLSLSKPGGGRKERGRISYAQLGINQLGAVYEGILSYSGFFAKDDLYEVREAGKADGAIFFVPEGETGEYREDEFVTEPDPDREGMRRRRKHDKGSFVFHLAGRDRTSSASYYTPEVLTKCVVERALRERLQPRDGEPLTADQILELTVLEPAVGSGAFLNEAINQLADAYLERKQRELGKQIPPAEVHHERQKVKAYLAAHNVYGVDLNPIAAELAKVSLWLNTLYKDSHTPWYGLRIAVGNSLIGCRRAVWTREQVRNGEYRETAPTPIRMGPEWTPLPKGAIYHFLLPVDGMVDVGDKVVRDLAPEAAKRVKDWRKDFIGSRWEKTRVDRLVGLSRDVDALWKQVVEERRGAAERCRGPRDLWGQPKQKGEMPRPAEQEKIAAELEEKFHAGPRLKLLMDYWCALWFWPLDETAHLPSPDVWLMDIDTLLKGTMRGVTASQLPGLEAEGVDTDPEKSFVTQHGFVDTDKLAAEVSRLRVARNCGVAHTFHHWELRFAELFADRGGFEIVLGNPPWVKVQWEESGILSEAEPVFALRKLSASEVAKRRGSALKKPSMVDAYIAEWNASSGSSAFFASSCNYQLLQRIQPNLYKLFIVKAWDLAGRAGVVGLLHPEGVYDDPKGGEFRRALYARLRSHLHFLNEMKLFPDIGGTRAFSANVYGSSGPIAFDHVSNLFHPHTLYESEAHDGHGPVPGIKNDDDKWETRGHRSRIVRVTEHELATFAKLYDTAGTAPEGARLAVVHSDAILDVLEHLADVPRRLGDLRGSYMATVMWDETNDVKKTHTIRRETRYPRSVGEWILSGPHFHVGTPLNKTPNANCSSKGDYSSIDLEAVQDDYLPRTNYVPACDATKYATRTPNWNGGHYTDAYRLAFRSMLDSNSERTLIGAIIPPGAAHIHTVHGFAFKDFTDLCTFCALSCSLVYDFLIRSWGGGFLSTTSMDSLPLPIMPDWWLRSAIGNVVALNCLTSHFSDLYEQVTKKLGNPQRWSRSVAERTDAGRRQLLVELDVLGAVALGLTEDELATIIRVQFPVLRKYERTNRYDANGRLVPSDVLKAAKSLEVNTRGPLKAPSDEKPRSSLFEMPVATASSRSRGRRSAEQDVDAPRLVAINHPKLGHVGAFSWTDPKMEPRKERFYVPPFRGFDREEDMREAYRRFAPLLDEKAEVKS